MEESVARNIYLPITALIVKVSSETADTFTFDLRFRDGTPVATEQYGPGKFLQVTAFGVGEAPISLAGADAEKGEPKITVRAVGSVTGTLCRLRVGGEMRPVLHGREIRVHRRPGLQLQGDEGPNQGRGPNLKTTALSNPAPPIARKKAARGVLRNRG